MRPFVPRISNHFLRVSRVRRALTACRPGWYLLLVIVDPSIQVGVSGPTVWVKVEGKGSFLNSGNLKEFAREMLDRGYREFVVDLADCAMMDSTFMGTMASVALRLKELGHGHLHIVHCGNRSHELLSGLGLDQIFDIRANGSSPPDCGKGTNGDDAGSA
jgi:anti-anti-sigma regulatory factor